MGWLAMSRKPVRETVREVPVPDPAALMAAATAYAEVAAHPDGKAIVKMGIMHTGGNLVRIIDCKPEGADEYWIDEVVAEDSRLWVLRNKNGVISIAWAGR